jgi:hypothetical protein
LVSFGHCIVSPSLIYGFWITPLVSFGHCIVSPSLICTFLDIIKKVQIKEELTIQGPKDPKGVVKKVLIKEELTIQ